MLLPDLPFVEPSISSDGHVTERVVFSGVRTEKVHKNGFFCWSPLRGSLFIYSLPPQSSSSILLLLILLPPSPCLLNDMLVTQVPPKTQLKSLDHDDPLVVYARALHDYTLRLWSESRRLAEERRRAQEMMAQQAQTGAASAIASQPPK